MIKYKDLIDLGFKREDYQDSVYFSQTGYQPFYLTLDITQRISFQYNAGYEYVSLLRCNKEGAILGEIRLDNIEEIKRLVNFFKGEKEIQVYDIVC